MYTSISHQHFVADTVESHLLLNLILQHINIIYQNLFQIDSDITYCFLQYVLKTNSAKC